MAAKRALPFVDHISDNDAPPKKKRNVANPIIYISDSDATAEFDAHSVAVTEFNKLYNKLLQSFAPNSGPATWSGLEFKEKEKVAVGDGVYDVYPPYAPEDLEMIAMPGDEDASSESDIRNRYLSAPRYAGLSCAVDTFLWLSTVLNIRRTRSDVCSKMRGIGLKKSVTTQVIRYLQLPIERLRQSEIDRLRNLIRDAIIASPELGFDPSRGMNIHDLFTHCWRSIDPEVPLHMAAWTRAEFRYCGSCPGYGIRRSPRDGINLDTRQRSKLSLGAHLQDYFDPQTLLSPSGGTLNCPHCKGKTFQQQVVLDRMPQYLVWLEGCGDKDREEYIRDAVFTVSVADETPVPEAKQFVFTPRTVQVTYKPVALALRDTAQDIPHWIGASCLPYRDVADHGRNTWVSYDGAAVENTVFVRHRARNWARAMTEQTGLEVGVVILEKVKEVDVDQINGES